MNKAYKFIQMSSVLYYEYLDAWQNVLQAGQSLHSQKIKELVVGRFKSHISRRNRELHDINMSNRRFRENLKKNPIELVCFPAYEGCQRIKFSGIKNHWLKQYTVKRELLVELLLNYCYNCTVYYVV